MSNAGPQNTYIGDRRLSLMGLLLLRLPRSRSLHESLPPLSLSRLSPRTISICSFWPPTSCQEASEVYCREYINPFVLHLYKKGIISPSLHPPPPPPPKSQHEQKGLRSIFQGSPYVTSTQKTLVRRVKGKHA